MSIIGLFANRAQSAWLSILGSMNCGAVTFDYVTGKLHTRDSWNEMLGYSQGPSTRDEFLKLVAEEDRAVLSEAYQAYVAKRSEDINCDLRVRRGDGGFQWLHLRAKVVKWDRRGRPRRLIAIFWDVDRRHRAVDQQAELTRFMASTLPSITSHIAVIDRSGRIMLANEAWSSFDGAANTLGERPAVGTNYFERLGEIGGDHAANAAAVRANADRMFEGADWHGQIEYQVGPGSNPRTFVLRLFHFDLPSGRCITVSHREITEQRNTERTLRESQERWKFAIEGSGDGVFDWDVESGKVHRSGHSFKMLGLREDEQHQDLRDLNLVHPDDLAVVDAKLAALISGSQDLCAYEHRLRHADGTWRWIMVRCTVIRRGPDGKAIRILGVHTDISALKQVESELRAQQSENRMLALVAEHTTNGVLVMDAAARIEWVNRGFEAMTGYSLAEVRGRRPDAVLSGPDTDPEILQTISRKIDSAETIRVKVLNYRKDNRPLWVSLEIQPIRESNGAVQRHVAIMNDVTEYERLESERRLSQKLQSVGQLASGIAHEINTPIQFVGDSITFIAEAWQSIEPFVNAARSSATSLDGVLQDGDLEFVLDNFPVAIARARDGVKRVAGIVRAMKEFAHPEREQFERTDINRALQNTIVVARHEYKHVGTVQVDCGTVPLVRCRISGINQVLLNLIVNAAHALADKKHRPDTGCIRIGSRCEGDWVVISVEDNGCGIPDGIRERIFDPFFTSKEVGRGTGQGLAIARAIVVEQHAGRLLFDSKIGEGSTFEMWLPKDGPAGEGRPSVADSEVSRLRFAG